MFSLGSEIIILKQLYSQTNAATLMIQMDSYGWLLNGHYSNKTVTSAKRKRVVMWPGILGSGMKCPFSVSEGVKMIFARYIEFITDHFLLWCNK